MSFFRRASNRDGGLSRRHVLAGAAWSAPVVLFAAAAPAFAASSQLDATLVSNSYSGTTKTYTFTLATQTGPQPITALKVRFTLVDGSAKYALTGQTAPANFAVSSVTEQSVTFTYQGSVPQNATVNTVFNLIRANNNVSNVRIDFLVSTATQTDVVAESIFVQFLERASPRLARGSVGACSTFARSLCP